MTKNLSAIQSGIRFKHPVNLTTMAQKDNHSSTSAIRKLNMLSWRVVFVSVCIFKLEVRKCNVFRKIFLVNGLLNRNKIDMHKKHPAGLVAQYQLTSC